GNAWKGKAKTSQQDKRIQDGLKHLGKFVGQPPKDWNNPVPMRNLYYLWSLERTAMLYSLKTIGGKDWYAWTAHMLVTNQTPNGSWTGGGYYLAQPELDTSMALLILRRANLAEDLSHSLRLFIPIVDPDK